MTEFEQNFCACDCVNEHEHNHENINGEKEQGIELQEKKDLDNLFKDRRYTINQENSDALEFYGILHYYILDFFIFYSIKKIKRKF
jgi:hypothetical protein